MADPQCLLVYLADSYAHFNKFFKNAWGLDGKFGSYFRTTFPSNELAKRNPSLATSYRVKAVHVDHISPDMEIYFLAV